MKFQKLFLTTATGCLLLGASGAAMAVDCPSGFIIGARVTDITIDGQPCHIEDTIVDGNVTITNSPNINMFDVEVAGNVSVTGPAGNTSNTSLSRVDSFGGNIDVNGHAIAIVSACIARGGVAGTGNVTVNNNLAAAVVSNVVVGDLNCAGNGELEDTFNRVYGTDDCREEQ